MKAVHQLLANQPFLKRLVTSCAEQGDYVSASILLQYEPSKPYDHLFSYLKKAIPSLLGSIPKEGILNDPPFDPNCSAVFGYFDQHVMEYIVSVVSDRDQRILDVLLPRFKSPIYDHFNGALYHDFSELLFIWNIQRMCVSLHFE